MPAAMKERVLLLLLLKNWERSSPLLGRKTEEMEQIDFLSASIFVIGRKDTISVCEEEPNAKTKY